MKSSTHNSSSTSLSSTAVPGSVAVRLHKIYRKCLEHISWARIVLETSRERISFSCRKPPTAASSCKQKKNAQQMQNEERGTGGGERNGWRRNNRSLTSPAPTAAAGLPAVAVPVPPTAADAAADSTAATAASYAAVTAGSHGVVTDKAVAAETATAPETPPTKRPKVTAVATRASERLSVMAKRRSIPQLDGGFSPSDSSFEAFSPAPAHPAPAPLAPAPPDPADPALTTQA
jgi:hypothetical protein